jgi:hypothetical protein
MPAQVSVSSSEFGYLKTQALRTHGPLLWAASPALVGLGHPPLPRSPDYYPGPT